MFTLLGSMSCSSVGLDKVHNKEFDIDDFRRLMGVDDKYSQFGQLKDRVITPALEQINEFTDHEIRVSYRKVGPSIPLHCFQFQR